MLSKLKICAGFDGNSHEAYIYKNINGKKYCKSCAYKLNPPKSINKISTKQTFKIKLKSDLLEKDKEFYYRLWSYRMHCCENCGKSLGDEPNMMFFHHILEKRNYPYYRYEPANISILCPECHSLYETNPDKVPYLVKVREMLKVYYQNKNLKNE